MDDPFRSRCAIASALEIIGDKWTLVIVRSLIVGATSYTDLLAAPEKIATNILADRLARLEAQGLIACERAPVGGKARLRYRLTPAGAELLPVLQAIAAWGATHLPGRSPVPDWFREARPQDLLTDRAPAALPLDRGAAQT